MQQSNDEYVKILFRFYSNLLDQWTVETMWAITADATNGYYQLASIPFYVPNVSSGDIVFAEYNEAEQMLAYQETIHHSGNSTIQVVIMDNAVSTDDVRNIFNALNCPSEKFKEGYFVLEVSAAIDYQPIRKKLLELENEGTIDYAESNLAENHWY